MTATSPMRAAALAAGVTVLCAAALAAPCRAASDDRFAGVEVTPSRVSGNVYMITGAGGNIGASVGADGTLIIDDQFAPLAERIMTALDRIDGAAPKIVLNTHFHADHTGGNPVFGQTGTIIAQTNVRQRLLSDEDFPGRGLPVVTFSDRITVHFNGDTLDVIHLPPAHTDGDSVVWFKGADVLHTGDLLFNGAFPVIDLSAGGSVSGVIDGLARLIGMVDDEVKIIPGHGPLATRKDMQASLEMIRETRAEVSAALGHGSTVDEIVIGGLDQRWKPWGNGFVSEERWIRTLAADAGAGP